MKKLIAVTASLIAAASLTQASAAEVKADKISVSDLFDLVKNNSCVSSVLPELDSDTHSLSGILSYISGLKDSDCVLPDIGNSQTLKDMLSKLFEHIKSDKTEDPDDNCGSDSDCGSDETPDCPDSGCPGEIPDKPETPDKPDDSDKPAEKPFEPSEKPDTPSEKPDDSTNGSTSNNSYVNAVLTLVNKYRNQNGLASVSLDSALCGAADVRAKEIVSSFSHTRPNGSSCFTVLAENGISYSGAGENIAYGQSSPDKVMTAWMNSSGHRANILNASFTKLGVGVYQSGGTLYWTQIFTY